MLNKKSFAAQKNYKYVAKFEATAFQVYSPTQQDEYIVKASFDKLKPFLPKNINLDENQDLIGITANLTVANRVNKNGQALSGELLKKVAPNFKFKQVNIEHSRHRCVGVCVDIGYSAYGSDEPLTEEQVDQLIVEKKPFNLVASSYIWRIVAGEEICDFLEETNNPLSSNFGKGALSWEVAFGGFNIGVGSKDMATASYITDEKEIEEIHSKLSHFGGTGMHNGQEIFLNLTDDILPLGYSLVSNPAADVSSILVAGSDMIPEVKAKELEEKDEDNDSNEDECDDDCECENCKKCNEDDEELAASMKKNNFKPVDTKDKVYNNQSDETKFGPTNSPIVDTAFELETKVKTAIKAFSKEVLNEDSINKRYIALVKVLQEKNLVLSSVLDWTEENFETKYNELVANKEKNEESVNKKENLEKTSVIAKTTNETKRKQTIMKLKSLDELTDEKLVAGEITAGVIADFLGTKIDALSAEWAAKEKEKADALALATENASTIGTKLATVEAELETLKNEAIAREKAEVFNTRIAALAEDFEFSDEQREIVASEIKDLDSESFDKYLKKLELFAKKKMKQGEKDREDEKLGDEVKNLKKEEKKDAKASEVFASLQVDADQVVPPNVAAPLESLKERWAAGFANGGVKVSRG